MLIPIRISYLEKLDPTDDRDKNRFGKWTRYNSSNEIIRILSEQFKIKISDKTIHKAVDEFPNISGRTIKNILKLSKLLAERRKCEVDFDIIKYASNFIDYTHKKDNE
jgi:hypothetical protein